MGYQSIYNRLRANGLTEAGALGMLGNFDCESNCVSCRLQGDYSYPYNRSREYTADVDGGRISRVQFMNDRKGYGLAQWTYWSRKAALYDFREKRGGSIGDEKLQVEFCISELAGEFSGLLGLLRSCSDLYQCTKEICYKYENPEIKNTDQRFAAAKRIRGEIILDGTGTIQAPEPEPEPQPTPEPEIPGWATIPATETWPPRMIDNGMSGDDVAVLQAVLKARGYNVNVIDGHFAAWLEDIVKDFQRSYGLDADGVVGPLTWGQLLERG